MAKAGLLFVGTDDGLVLFSDPGATGRWLRVGQELRGEVIAAVWPQFDDPQTVLAGGAGGLWRSDDGGASWAKISGEPIRRFAGEKGTPQVIAALTDAGWQRSTDGGATWQPSIDSTNATPDQMHQITLAGQKPVVLRIDAALITRSDDDGATWQATMTDQPWSGAITVIVAARYHIDVAFAGSATGQLGMSSDRGRNWQIVKHNLPSIHAIAAARLV